MEFNIEVRKKQLQSLDQYITSSKDKVQSILDYLGWNAKKLLDKEVKITCSVNPSHQIQLKNVEHIEKCCLKTLGYSPDEQFLSEPLHNPTSSIKLDNVKKLEILGQARYNNPKFKAAWNGHDCDPMTSDRIFSTFSVDERITLYDYCAKNTEGPPTPKEFIIHDDRKEEKLATEEELLVKERNSKRRRTKYRSVHTGRNKSHTEVMKEVIENQMELYKEYLAKNTEKHTYSHGAQDHNNDHSIVQYSGKEYVQQNERIHLKEQTDETERPHSSVSRHSAHSGSSRSKKDYDHYKNHTTKKYEEYNKKKYDRHAPSPGREKRRKYCDYKDANPYSRDRKDQYYKADYRH